MAGKLAKARARMKELVRAGYQADLAIDNVVHGFRLSEEERDKLVAETEAAKCKCK